MMVDFQPPPIFSIVPIEMWLDRRITLEQMRVLGALFSFRGKNTNAVWPSRELIASRCGMGPQKISEATTALVNLGWLIKDGRGGFSKATRYTITVPDSVTVPQSVTVAEQGMGGVADSVTGMGVTESVTGKEHTKNITNGTDHRVVRTNGTRLHADWSLPDEWQAWAISNLDWDAARCQKVADTFADYWRGVAGAKARKADWFATWRNWARRDGGNVSTGRRTASEGFDKRDYGKGGLL